MRRDHIQAILAATLPFVDPSFKADANETAAFARQLEFFYAKIYEKEYPEFMGRSLIPLETSVPTGAEAHTFRMFDDVGEAKITHSYAEDAPVVEVYGQEFAKRIFPIRDAFFVSIQDIRAAKMFGMDIDTRKAIGARRIMEQKLDVLAALGSLGSKDAAGTDLVGFCNAETGVGGAGVPVLNTGSTPALTGSWASASSSVIQADIETIAGQVFSQTLGVHGNPDNGSALTLVLPTNLFKLISNKRIDTFNEKTIYRYVLESMPFIKEIRHWGRLNTAGAGATQRVVAYHKSDDVCSMVIPQEFEMLPMVPKPAGYHVDCHLRYGGIKWVRPLGAVYADGC
jgi:hypothetical protein